MAWNMKRNFLSVGDRSVYCLEIFCINKSWMYFVQFREVFARNILQTVKAPQLRCVIVTQITGENFSLLCLHECCHADASSYLLCHCTSHELICWKIEACEVFFPTLLRSLPWIQSDITITLLVHSLSIVFWKEKKTCINSQAVFE
jgi:hypothetical protein